MKNKFVVIGGAGAMGKITVRDLLETSSPETEVVIADYDLEKAKLLEGSLKAVAHKRGTKIQSVRVDLNNFENTLEVLQSATVVINTAPYEYNLRVMECALAMRSHYVDLGGLFHVTRKQLQLNDQFQSIGRTALLGMGAAPGITNILAKHVADRMDKVTEIHCRVGSADSTRYSPQPALPVSYSLATILEEFSFEPAVFTKGEFKFVEPMSGDVPHRFPKPVGLRKPMYTIHSEVATLPLSYADKGIQEVSFKIAFDPEFTERVRFLRDLGMGSNQKVHVAGVLVKPRDVINKVAMTQPVPKIVGKLKQYEVVRSIVKGIEAGKKITWIVDCHTSGMPQWGIGLDIDTGSPPAIAAQMLAAQEITTIGAVPPEVSVPSKKFFQHLLKRKMKVKALKKSGWAVAT